MRRSGVALFAFLAVAVLLLPGSARAGLLSKSYVFKPGTLLEVGAEIDEGLRLDKVRFVLPASEGGKLVRTAGLAHAEVSISNTGPASRRVGIALALFDDDNRLLGVASGGMKLFPIKAGRQETYTLVFDNVNAEIPRATKFQITIEPRP